MTTSSSFLRRMALLGLLVGAAVSLPATDSVWVEATIPTADEQGLIPGKFTFRRSSTSGTLSINYRLAGTARSDLNLGHVAGATLPLYPNPSGSGYSGFSPLTTSVPGGTVPGVLATEIYNAGAWYCYTQEPGSGYLVPTAGAADATGAGVVLRVAVTGGAVSKIAVETGGSGYALPTLAMAGGGGTGATGRVTVQGGRVIGAVVTNSGSGYTGAPTVTLGGTPAVAAVITATVADGKVIALSVISQGSGYVTPTISVSGATGAGATAEATVDAGVITEVTVTNGGAGYGSVQTVSIADPYTGGETQAVASVRLCGPEYIHPSGTILITSGTNIGQLQGSLTFSPGESAKELVITPMRNAVGGGRRVVALLDPPVVAGAYTVDTQSSATVTINDADDQATVRVNSSVAYPQPPVISPGLPVEVQSRAEWRMNITGDPQTWRSVQITVQGDADLGPTAIQAVGTGTTGDYLLVSGLKPIEDTAGNYALVNHTMKSLPGRPATDTEPGPGTTEIGVPSTALNGTFVPGESHRLGVGDVVCFENPSNEFNGVYVITAIAGESETMFPVLTIYPALRVTTTGFGSTRIRRLGELVRANNYTRFSTETTVYYFGIPWNNGDLSVLTPRAPQHES